MWFGAIYDICHQEVIVKGFYEERSDGIKDLLIRLPDALYEEPLERTHNMTGDEDHLCISMEKYSHIDRSYVLIMEEDDNFPPK